MCGIFNRYFSHTVKFQGHCLSYCLTLHAGGRPIAVQHSSYEIYEKTYVRQRDPKRLIKVHIYHQIHKQKICLLITSLQLVVLLTSPKVPLHQSQLWRRRI